MRVPADPAGSATPPSRSREPAAPESKSFEKVLDRKIEDQPGKKKTGQKLRGPSLKDEGQEALATGAMTPLRDAAPSAVGKPAGGAEIRDLDGLVREILVVSGPGVDPKVEIQFHSSTLEGLNVRIVKKGDEISIRFLTGSESVAQLLSRNSEQLSQALQAKGLHAAPIQVELAPASPRSTEAGPSPRDGGRGRGRGDDRQQRHQK